MEDAGLGLWDRGHKDVLEKVRGGPCYVYRLRGVLGCNCWASQVKPAFPNSY